MGRTAPTPGFPDPELDRRERLIRIDRLREEGLRSSAEQRKLSVEAGNLLVTRYVTPIAAVLAAVAALVAAFPVVARPLSAGG